MLFRELKSKKCNTRLFKLRYIIKKLDLKFKKIQCN